MSLRLFVFVFVFVFWLLLFALQKPIFCAFHLPPELCTPHSALCTMHYALPLDLSMAGYLTLIPGLLLAIAALFPGRWLRYAMDTYMTITIALAMLVFVADMVLFPYWGTRLDKMALAYLAHPSDVLACAYWTDWLRYFAAWLLCTATVLTIYHFTIAKSLNHLIDKSSPLAPFGERVLLGGIGVLLTASLILPIRGSLTVSTMNTGRVYFSDRMELNIAAINPLFHLFESLSHANLDTDRYTYMPSDEARALVSAMQPASTTHRQVLGPVRRLVVVILESFSANAVGCLGGTPMTPCIDSIAREGILFTQAYSTGFRTDRGLVGILASYPSLPTTSLMNIPAISTRLPQFGPVLARAGYNLHFYYGGDEDFMCMRSLLAAGGYHDRVCDRDFPLRDRLSKWGAPDHILLRRAAEDILSNSKSSNKLSNSKSSNCPIILSLSSHEPFDMGGNYLTSVAYTDSCIGAFVRTLHQSPDWDSTLIVLCADHGYPYPADAVHGDPRRNHILMLLAGGAVLQPEREDRICSQCDLMPTVLSQLGLTHEPFRFSQDIYGDAYHEHAFFSYPDGFVLLTPGDTTQVDGATGKLLRGHHEREAKAYMQRVYETLSEYNKN